MLYVTVAAADARSTRSKYETEDVGEAVSQAVGKFQAELVEDAVVLTVLVERPGTQLSKGDLAEQIEQIRTAEVERARA